MRPEEVEGLGVHDVICGRKGHGGEAQQAQEPMALLAFAGLAIQFCLLAILSYLLCSQYLISIRWESFAVRLALVDLV